MSQKSTRLRNLLFPYILPRRPVRYSNQTDGNNIYGSGVLVGNWYENRLSDKKDKKAITPGIYGSSSCMKDDSVYQSDFKHHVVMHPDEFYADFVKWKQFGFSNRLNSSNTNIHFSNGDQFINNLTTLKDIMYRIIPKQVVDSNVLMPKKEKLNDDYMRSFGNSTRTGLLQWQKCEKYKDDSTPVDMSHYKHDYRHFKINKRVTSCKRPQRKTSLIGAD